MHAPHLEQNCESDIEEVGSKVKALLQIQEHSKELGGVIRNPEPTHKPSWGGTPRHVRRVDFSEDEEEDKFCSSKIVLGTSW